MGPFNLANRVMSLAVSGLVALCFLAFGLAAALYFGPQQILQARHVARLTPLGVADLQAAQLADEVLVYGTLNGNRSRGVDELVAYTRERWDVDTDSDGDLKGSWARIEQDVPGLNITVADGTIRTTQASEAVMGGDRYSRLIQQGTGSRRVNGIAEGSVRVIGFQDGHQITVLGHKTPDGLVAPDRLYGGDPAALAKEMQTGGMFFTGCGAALICLAPIIVLLGLFGRTRARFRR